MTSFEAAISGPPLASKEAIADQVKSFYDLWLNVRSCRNRPFV